MLDSPGHKAGSGPRYGSGPGPSATSRGPDQRAPGAAAPGRGTGSRGPARGPQAPPRGPLPWWGTRPGRLGVALVIGGAAAGLLITVLAGREPGVVLGLFLLAGTAAGALAVRPRAAYLIIPVPPLAYAVAAVLAGLIHDHATDTSHTALALGAAQWIASGFLAMSAATLLAIVVAAVRWAADRWAADRPRGPGPRPPLSRLLGAAVPELPGGLSPGR